jgi:hypothetical protein
VVLPVLWMLVLFGQELMVAYRTLADLTAQSPYTLPEFIRRIPWLGDQLQLQVNRYSAEPAVLVRQAGTWIQVWASLERSLFDVVLDLELAQPLAGGIVVMSRGLTGEFQGALPHPIGESQCRAPYRSAQGVEKGGCRARPIKGARS